VAGDTCKFVPVFRLFSLALGGGGSDANIFETIDEATIDMANATICAVAKVNPADIKAGTRIKDI
jgi:hypothetical protein